MLTYFEIIVLYGIKVFDGERSIYAIYHMLKGKKSSQTIQDAHLFGLSPLFGTLPSILRKDLEQTITGFARKEYIKKHTREDRYQITESGNVHLLESFKHCPLPKDLNGIRFRDSTVPFWERLSLLIQTLSHIVHSENRFYPIQRNLQVQGWVKHFLAVNQKNRNELAECLLSELTGYLETREPLEQNIFVWRLTGNRRIGSTYPQLAGELKLDEGYIRYVFLGTLHGLIKASMEEPARYSILRGVVKDLHKESERQLTQSTKVTLDYVLKGMELEEIAGFRRLKLNTIEDHIVEIVLTDSSFPIDSYVSAEAQQRIAEAVKSCSTRQLTPIKRALEDDEISFFQIRLVLAKSGGII
ncbi:helix-turn-helix domain-containing protein [Peribacillus psychrosaccharolyticus]|uniref:Helix-turn-helix domain-containing protein n=1 Tax=Peribacillus psychrosaccharolyticus TaxID=1407 RepID=A0A974NM05_PERPY|nr:helix-turn-helix domain-containing protein [Peribacillus psychrosaccharolyticus]MEC2056755.1 helix-turn-helix domain-containing protein [Peribacillus psychrosaccharolyticus]MED3746209.1 helix-turn-helix domain-containing protein [Peribacillus psychrosaccharolyticus]QQT00120.1 helix-turn-helix domain-containing protein [Peribacillus psychrosaccharolyticus]